MGVSEPLRVCVVEAQAVFRKAWPAIVNDRELCVARVVASVAEVPQSGIDVVVVDVDGEHESTESLIETLRARAGEIPICLVALRPAVEAYAARADRDPVLISKSAPPSHVRAAIRAAAERRSEVAITGRA